MSEPTTQLLRGTLHVLILRVLSEGEAHALYEAYSVPGSGLPLFQAATANFYPWTEARVDTRAPRRGPMLIIAGEKDHTVPPAISQFTYKLQQRNPARTEYREFKGRGHSLTIDSGWKDVAEAALAFVKQMAQAQAA